MKSRPAEALASFFLRSSQMKKSKISGSGASRRQRCNAYRAIDSRPQVVQGEAVVKAFYSYLPHFTVSPQGKELISKGFASWKEKFRF
jgi:hypothetical protein